MIMYQWLCLAPEHEERCTPEIRYHIPVGRVRRVNTWMCGLRKVHFRCDGQGCQATAKIGHWEQIRASSKDGWFFRKHLEECWCFEHLPPWVIPWRDRENPGWREKLRPELQAKLARIGPAPGVAR